MKIIVNYKIPIYENNKIINYIIKYNYEIIILDNKTNKKGGDVFDNINLEDIIIKKDKSATPVTKSVINVQSGEIDNILIKKHNIKFEKQKINNKKESDLYKGKYIIDNIKLNTKNSIYDIKLLIFYLLKISIEDQNILYKDNTSLYYDYIHDINKDNIDIDINKIPNKINVKYTNNLPIDLDIISNRSNYTIYTYEKNKYLDIFQYNNTKNIELDLFNLNDFIIDKMSLKNEISKDDELLDIIYKGFIEIYFPYYDINLFSLYLFNENKLISYPNLNIKINDIINKTDKLYDIYYNFTSPKLDITKLYKKLIYHIPSYNINKVINLKEFFNNLELKKISNLYKLELQLEVNNKIIYFSKQNIISKDYNPQKSEQISGRLNENISSKDLSYKEHLNNLYINNKNYNSLHGSHYLLSNIVLLVYKIIENESITEIYFIIDEYSNIFIIYNINEYIKLNDSLDNSDLKYYKTNIIKYTNKVLSELFNNKLIKDNKQINEYNIDLKLIDIQLILNQNINTKFFERLYLLLTEYLILDTYELSIYDNINNIIELTIKKINDNVDNLKLFQLFQNISDNFYNYYIKYDLTDKYIKTLYTSKIIISNRIKDLKIDILNISPNNLQDIKILISYIINQILSDKLFKSIQSNNKDNNVSKNKLKKLKEIDPVLFSINKRHTNNLYSRKCQANQQPDIIDANEAKKDKNAIKYINFTTGESIYYTCKHKKYPNVKFLTNLHPQNYCIPCCKKKSLKDVKIRSKYISIHNECLTTYKYDKKNKILDEKSRYIMNYSSKIVIENLRLMHIPNTLSKLFTKLFEDVNKNELKYYIMGINQHVGNIGYIGLFHILSFILNQTNEETIKYINKLFTLDNDLINNILNGRLLNYFSSLKDFLVVFNNIYQDKILLSNLNFEFNDWNELFIDILKYLGYICIIIEESNDDEIDLLIPPNIVHVNQYIYHNDNYNYIIIIKRLYKHKFLYYPIVKTNYKEYYNKNIFANKFFTYNSPLINLISEIIKSKLTNNKNSLALSLLEEFVLFDNNYNIEKYYINQKNEIYSILLSNNKKTYIYLNIEKEKITNNNILYKKHNINSKLYQSTYINITNYNIKLNETIIFIKDLNKYIYTKNKKHYSEFYYKSFINSINYKTLLEDVDNSLLNNIKDELYPYVHINNFLLYNKKIIGMQLITNINKVYNCYLSNNIDESICKNIIKSKNSFITKIFNKVKLTKNDIITVLTREFKNSSYSIIKYLYNPHDINNIIYSKKRIIDSRIKNINEAIYHTNLYNLLVIHFSNKLYKLKNTLFRSKIKHIINNMTKDDISLIISNQYNKIAGLVNKYINIRDEEMKLKILYNLSSFIKRNIISLIKNNKISDSILINVKKTIIKQIDITIFLFDNILIYSILELKKEDAIKELHNIFKDIISHKNLNKSNKTFNLDLCENIKESYSCDSNKLIISKELYNNLLEIWYYDLTNPFKQKLILNLVNYNLNNIYNFKQFFNEQIYIYLE